MIPRVWFQTPTRATTSRGRLQPGARANVHELDPRETISLVIKPVDGVGWRQEAPALINPGEGLLYNSDRCGRLQLSSPGFRGGKARHRQRRISHRVVVCYDL